MTVAFPIGAGSTRRVARALTLAALLLVLFATPALAAPEWHIDASANTNAAPGSTARFQVQLTNKGEEEADGTGGDPIVFTAAFPSELTVSSIEVFFPGLGIMADWSALGWTCTGDGPDGPPNVVGAHNLTCTIADRVLAHDYAGSTAPLQPIITVDVDGGAAEGTVESAFAVSGAGAGAQVSTAEVTRITTDAATFGVDVFDGAVTADASGTPYTQAGGHPYGIATTIDFNTDTNANPVIGPLWPVDSPRNLEVDLPPGFVGDATAAAQCTSGDLANEGSCPPASQVGTTMIRLGFGGGNFFGPLPVFNMEPPPDVPARFGFNAHGSIVSLDVQVRSDSDYGLTIAASGLPQTLAFTGTTVTFWGVPAADAHTAERACPGMAPPEYYRPGPTSSCANGGALVPLLRNPTSCTDPGVGLETTLRVDSWENPGSYVTSSFTSHEPPGYPYDRSRWGDEVGVTGCDRVPFAPEMSMTPGAPAAAGAPTGFAIDLSIPQSDDPNDIGQSDLRRAVVTLPEGVRVSPASAQGLGACSEAQIALDSTEAPTCPNASKIGTLTIDTPLLPDPLTGAVYLAAPFDNPFDSLLALYLVAEGPGLTIKLPGKVEANPSTGQLTTTFDDNPQLPFSNLHLEFEGGPRAPLVAPKRCGTYTTHAELIGWNGRTATSDSSFTLTENARGEPCPSTFTPGLDAGVESNGGGRSSPFHLRLTRDDEDQELRDLTVELPQGLLAKLADPVLCADGAAATGSCPDGSKVGTVTVGAGAGSNPFYITNGRVYLTGPYKGAPFGMSIVVPAVAGPFDLGTVVVRAAIFVDKQDATASIVSDPLPTILEGIPLDVRDVRVSIDRPGFMRNPTSCAVKQIGATVESTQGAEAVLSERFQAAECRSLELAPSMVVQVGGRGSTRRGRPTGLTTRLRLPSDGTNLRFVRVTLPSVLNARLTVINDACTRDQFERGDCAHAKAGTATAVTPLLRDPLRGSVYFVRNGNPLPDLFVALRGQVAFDLVGKITIPGSARLRTTFESVPDVPVSSFTLKLFNGRNASVGNAANLCSRRARSAKAELDFRGQNGRVKQLDKRLVVRGCGKQKGATRTRRG